MVISPIPESTKRLSAGLSDSLNEAKTEKPPAFSEVCCFSHWAVTEIPNTS